MQWHRSVAPVILLASILAKGVAYRSPVPDTHPEHMGPSVGGSAAGGSANSGDGDFSMASDNRKDRARRMCFPASANLLL